MHTSDELNRYLQDYRRQMAAVVWRVLRDTDQAEDALQDALLCIWKKRRVVLAHPNPPALILRMCFQTAIDRLRQYIRLRTEPIPATASINATSPLDCMIGEETRRQILIKIAQLPGQQAEAIYLRVIEQMPYDDIAAALSCTASTARAHVRRARERLRQDLAPLMPNEVCHESR